MRHPLTPMLEAYKEKLLKRKKYLHNRIRFLDALPQNRISHKYGVTFPNTLPYNVSFKEMHDINDMLSNINDYLDRYVSDVCLVCNKIIGHDFYERHHISYYPEITILVHQECHNKIHHTDDYPHLKRYFSGDGTDFYNDVKKPDYWVESGILGHELKCVYSARESCYPRPNLKWNRAVTTERDIKYDITYRKVTEPRT